MAEAWDDENFFNHGLEAGHGVEKQTSSTRFFSTTNGVPTTDRKLFECSGGAALLHSLPSVALGGCLPHSAPGNPLSLVQDGAHAEVAQPDGEWGGGNSLMPNWRSSVSASHHHHTGSPTTGNPMHSGSAATHGIPNSGWQQGVPAATHPLATHPLSATSNSGCQLPLLPPNSDSHSFLPPFSSPMGRGQTHLPVISGFNMSSHALNRQTDRQF